MIRRAPLPNVTPPITRQEQRVLEYIASGYTDQAIARLLQVSVVTVRRRATSLRVKLGARNRAEAVAIAVGRGLFRHPST